jgi:uncharacterized protein (TIGR00369 family)
MSTDVLQQWQDCARTLQGGNGEVGLARPEQVLGRSGLELFQAMLAGELPSPPITQTLGFSLVEAEAGRVVFQGKPAFAYYNPLGSVHGGWYATLLDSALACAVHSTLPAGRSYTTLELKLNMVRALTEKVPLVRAEGKIIHAGRQVATAEGRLYGPDGTLYAHATTTCLIFDLPAARG